MSKQLRVETGQGEVTGIYLATLTERDCMCSCTWIWTQAYMSFRLKYRDTSCRALGFHSRLGRMSVPPIVYRYG